MPEAVLVFSFPRLLYCCLFAELSGYLRAKPLLPRKSTPKKHCSRWRWRSTFIVLDVWHGRMHRMGRMHLDQCSYIVFYVSPSGLWDSGVQAALIHTKPTWGLPISNIYHHYSESLLLSYLIWLDFWFSTLWICNNQPQLSLIFDFIMFVLYSYNNLIYIYIYLYILCVTGSCTP